MAVIDLTGQVFGRLTVISLVGRTKHRVSTWLCTCTCGKTKTVISGNLKSGITTSCGCYSAEQVKVRCITHGMADTPEYYSWQDLRKRCSGYNDKAKQNYVDRGITVHEDFENSFEAFYKEIGVKPDNEHTWTVGRIDNNLGYTYGNLRWETNTQQARNKTKRVDNKTGVTGVHLTSTSYVAQTKGLDGKFHTKTFSIKKYGKENAFQLAVQARELMIKLLNEQGAGYSETHGKDK